MEWGRPEDFLNNTNIRLRAIERSIAQFDFSADHFKKKYKDKIDEHTKLFIKGLGTRNITPYLETSGWWVWSDDIRDSSSAWAYFYNHNLTYWYSRDGSDVSRAFAVRSRGDG